MIPCSNPSRVAVTSASGERSVLTPCIVPIDGNEFYVYASIAIYGRYDSHQKIRELVWNAFCVNVFGIHIRDLIASGNNLFAILDNVRDKECFIEWLRLVSPKPEETAKTIDLNTSKLSDAMSLVVRNNACDGFTYPSLTLVSCLLSECFGVGLVLYDAASTSQEHWEPYRIWHPNTEIAEGSEKGIYIHLMKRGLSLEMLLKPANDNNPLKPTYPIPTRVISKLPIKLREQVLNSNYDVSLISKHGIFSLCAYDVKNRANVFIAHFISPATKILESARTIHFLRIDTQINTQEMIYCIAGCTEYADPVFVYASWKSKGIRFAVQIARWAIDYYNPRVVIKPYDDTLIVVPCNDKKRAAQLVALEYKCQIYDRRPESVVQIEKDKEKK